MVLIEKLLPRNSIFINNKFNLINDSKDDFHYVIYYINNFKCKIIIRRLDTDGGWGINLKIKLYNSNCDNEQILSVGSSESNCKMIDIYTNIELFQEIYQEQIIPRIIIQTIYNKNIDNTYLHNSILSYIELNPEYEYNLFDDNDCRLFIKNNYDENILIAYDMLIAGAFKADLFRYCYLYINGGCYFDCKSILRISLRNIINKDDNLILCQDIGIGYFNAVMFSSKKNDLLLKVINCCVDNIHNFYKNYNLNNIHFNKAENILSLTGPVFLYNILNRIIDKSRVLRLYHKNINNKNHNYQKLLIEYNGQHIITKNYCGFNSLNSHYSKLWYNKEIIYTNSFNNDNYRLYQFNFNVNDIFIFHIFNCNSIIIQRIDKNSGWDNHLKIKIVDELNNNEVKIEIGNSNSVYKLINLYNKFFKFTNIIDSFKNINDSDNNKYLISVSKLNNIYKIIVIRIDKNEGWTENLTFNIDLKNNIQKNVIIGDSQNNIKILNFE